MQCFIPDTSFQLIFIHTPDNVVSPFFLSSDPQKKNIVLDPMAVHSWQNLSTTEECLSTLKSQLILKKNKFS